MKRVVFFESAQNLGGARIATVDLAERLTDYYDCHIVDAHGSCSQFVDYCKKKDLQLHIVHGLSEPTVISSKTKIQSIFNLLKSVPLLLITKRKSLQLLGTLDADYVCVNSLRTLFYMYRHKLKAKIVFFAHGWYIPRQISPILKFLFKKTVDIFVCGSEATRHALFCGNIAPLSKLEVVHIGIDETRMTLNKAQFGGVNNGVKILHAAGFTCGKGQLVSVEVARLLKERGLPFKMILAGLIYAGQESQSYYDKVLTLIKQYGLESEVELVTNKSNIIDYMRACDILIHPSDSEGLGMVIMEAMCLKKVVVCNAVGGTIDMVLDGFTGYLTRYNNVEDYVGRIEQLYNDKSLYQYISDNAYSLIQNSFTIQKQVDAICRIFK